MIVFLLFLAEEELQGVKQKNMLIRAGNTVSNDYSAVKVSRWKFWQLMNAFKMLR